MSENIFQVIDQTSSQGLEATLKEIERVANDEHDYSTVRFAQFHLAKIEFGIPSNSKYKGDIPGFDESWDLLQELNKTFSQTAGEAYKAEHEFEKAASQFSGAENFREAIDMYLLDASDQSKDMASYLALTKGVDYKLGFDLRIQNDDISRAIYDLNELKISEKFTLDDRQKWGEYITKAVYAAVVEKIKDEIEKNEDRPKGDTITQLLKGRDGQLIYVNDTVIDPDFRTSLSYVEESKDPEILQIGIELNDFRLRMKGEDKYGHFKDVEMMLRGKLTGNDEYIEYFVNKAEEDQLRDNDSHWNSGAYRAVKILRHHSRYAEALEITERFLPISYKIDLLEELGDTGRLALVHKEMNNPIKYALITANQNA